MGDTLEVLRLKSEAVLPTRAHPGDAGLVCDRSSELALCELGR